MALVDRKTDGFHGEICPEWKKNKQKLETSMVLVVRKTDGFQDEICPEWKKDKHKLETSF